MDKIDAAWAAGIYEGEGCIVPIVGTTGRMQVQLNVGSTDLDVLEKLLSVTGFGRITGPYLRDDRKPKWCWRAHGWETAKTIFAAFEPHLCSRRTKRYLEVLAMQPPPPNRFQPKLRRLTQQQIQDILDLLAVGNKQIDIAKKMKVSQGTISKIKVGYRYAGTTGIAYHGA